MKILFPAALLFLLCFSIEAEAALRIVAFAYPPFRISSSAGIDNEIFAESCRAAGLPEMLIEMYPPSRARSIFENDPAAVFLSTDAICRTLSVSKVAMFVCRPLKVFQYHLKSRFPGGEPKRAADFRGKTMGFYAADSEAGKAYTDRGCSVIPVNDNRFLYRMLLAGRFDLMISVDLAADLEFAKLNPQWRSVIGVSAAPVYSGSHGLLYHRDNHESASFVARYAKGYDLIVKNGTYAAILAKYSGKMHVSGAAAGH